MQKTCGGKSDPSGAYVCAVGECPDGFCPDCTEDCGQRHAYMNARGEATSPECACERCAEHSSGFPECYGEDDEPCPGCMVEVEGGDHKHVCICDDCDGKCTDAAGRPCGACVYLDGTHLDPDVADPRD